MRPFRTLGTLTACLLIAASLTAPEAKADAPSWTGFYLGVHGGYSFAKTDVELTGTPLALNGLGSDGMTGGIHIGYDHQIGSVVLGLLGEWNGLGKTEFEVTPNLLKYEIKDGFLIAGRVGLAWGNALPYVMVGWAKHEADLSFLGTSVDSHDLDGLALGAGIDVKLDDLAKGLRVGLRYTQIQFDSHDVLGAGVVGLDTDLHKAEVRISYQFGADVLNQKSLFPGK